MIEFDKAALKTMVYWITQRESIRVLKDEKMLPKPWTKDQYLRDYRWCNVRRMDDRVSRWLLANWYTKGMSARTALVAATLARMINWPDSLAAIAPMGFKVWSYDRAMSALHARKAAGHKIFTGAYIINGAGGGDKVKLVLDTVQAVAQAGHGTVNTDSMRITWENLQKFRGVGSFIAGQIMADLRHVLEGDWLDHMEWAPIGPGSRRGMRRMLGLPAPGPMRQDQFDKALPVLWDRLMSYSDVSEIYDNRHCEAMDLQNCLCEFDKYNRLKFENGHVRSGYDGHGEQGSLL